MSRNRTLTNLILVLVFAAACVFAMEFLAVNIGQPLPGFLSHHYTVRADFYDADGIPTAADVRASGVVVGKVTAIQHDPKHPGVTQAVIEITDSHAQPIYANSCVIPQKATQDDQTAAADAGQGYAKVRPKTLLGEKYIDLYIGTPTRDAVQNGGQVTERCNTNAVGDNGELATNHTSKDVSNDEIFNAFDQRVRDEQKSVLRALDDATSQRAGDISAILPQLTSVVQNLETLSQTFNQPADLAEVDDILQNLNVTLATLADEHVQVGQLLSNGRVALGAIATRDQALIATLQRGANVAQELNRAMEPTVAANRASLDRLAPTLDAANALLDQIVGPHCGGRPCGIDTVFSGTLSGQLNYPNDQLTVTSAPGETVANEWALMFSQPTPGYLGPVDRNNPNNSHTALNLVLSVHCQSIADQLGTIQGLPGGLGPLLQAVCQVAAPPGGVSGASQPAPSPPGATVEALYQAVAT